jgi:hypothetical protein
MKDSKFYVLIWSRHNYSESDFEDADYPDEILKDGSQIFPNLDDATCAKAKLDSCRFEAYPFDRMTDDYFYRPRHYVYGKTKQPFRLYDTKIVELGGKEMTVNG